MEGKEFEDFVQKCEVIEKAINNIPRRFVKVPIKYNGKDEFVLLKKLGWRERERLRGRFVTIETSGKEGKEIKGEVNTEDFKAMTLLTSLYEAPFAISNAFLDSCEDFELLDLLFSVSNKINSLELEKK